MVSDYIENPKDCRFEGQDPDEVILLLLRPHPITNLGWILTSLSLIFLPMIVSFVLMLLKIDTSFVPPMFIVTFLIINYLLVLLIVFEGFLYWYFNVYIITDKNIVDVDFHSILFKNIDVAPLSNVEDVSSSMGGLTQSVFHYGNVFVQTAGATKNIDLINVPLPHKVADFILDETHKKTENATVKEALSDATVNS